MLNRFTDIFIYFKYQLFHNISRLSTVFSRCQESTESKMTSFVLQKSGANLLLQVERARLVFLLGLGHRVLERLEGLPELGQVGHEVGDHPELDQGALDAVLRDRLAQLRPLPTGAKDKMKWFVLLKHQSWELLLKHLNFVGAQVGALFSHLRCGSS